VFFADTRGFYCERDYLWGDAIHNTLIPYGRFGNAREMALFLRDRGITHALVNYAFAGRGMPDSDSPAYLRLVAQAVRDQVFRPVFPRRSRKGQGGCGLQHRSVTRFSCVRCGVTGARTSRQSSVSLRVTW